MSNQQIKASKERFERMGLDPSCARGSGYASFLEEDRKIHKPITHSEIRSLTRAAPQKKIIHWQELLSKLVIGYVEKVNESHPLIVAKESLEERKKTKSIFDALLQEWNRDTEMLSDQVAILTHPAHLKIIGLGKQAIPFILRDLKSGGGPWFVALESITRLADFPPKHHRNDSSVMREDWLKWGAENDYISK